MGIFGSGSPRAFGQNRFSQQTQPARNSDQGWNRNTIANFAALGGAPPAAPQAQPRASDQGWNRSPITSFAQMPSQMHAQMPGQMHGQMQMPGTLAQYLAQPQPQDARMSIVQALMRR